MKLKELIEWANELPIKQHGCDRMNFIYIDDRYGVCLAHKMKNCQVSGQYVDELVTDDTLRNTFQIFVDLCAGGSFRNEDTTNEPYIPMTLKDFVAKINEFRFDVDTIHDTKFDCSDIDVVFNFCPTGVDIVPIDNLDTNNFSDTEFHTSDTYPCDEYVVIYDNRKNK